MALVVGLARGQRHFMRHFLRHSLHAVKACRTKGLLSLLPILVLHCGLQFRGSCTKCMSHRVIS